MNIECDLTGRVAVVTGASSGIGEQTARAFDAAGAVVALVARREDRLKAIAADIRSSGGDALVFPADVTDAEAVAAVAEAVRGELGTVGIVFNNAGIMLPGAARDLAGADTVRQVALNVTALNTVVAVFADQLVEAAGAQGTADLVNVASIAGRRPFPGFVAYSASKAYVVQLSATLRAELGPKNVRVTAVEPGIVATELQSHIQNEAIRDRLAGTRASIDWLEAEDIAELVTFTVSRPPRVSLPELPVLPTRQAG
jgi:NADP-dependent 3-hydroxy acid dehydrogenase YdfG